MPYTDTLIGDPIGPFLLNPQTLNPFMPVITTSERFLKMNAALNPFIGLPNSWA